MSGTSARRLKTMHRRKFALDQRRGGLSYRQIAAAAVKEFGAKNLPKGYDERYAWFDVRAVLRQTLSEVEESADELRLIEAERYDQLQAALWVSALRGEVKSVDRVLRIIQQRSTLLGLNSPTKVEIPDGITIRHEYPSQVLYDAAAQALRNLSQGSESDIADEFLRTAVLRVQQMQGDATDE